MSGKNLQKWLVIFNCQAQGLGFSLSLLSDAIEVSVYNLFDFKKAADELVPRLDEYDRIIVATWIERHLGIDLGQRENLWRIPVYEFRGYHPDHCNIICGDDWLGGPLNGNFSALSFAAFKSGLDREQAISLYNEDVYSRLGYLDHWDVSRDALLRRYEALGFDLGTTMVDWSRRGLAPFVPAHPQIRCLRDIAKIILQRAGLPVLPTEMLPPDNLAKGVVFPVYPEIGSHFGISGGYFFKPSRSYKLMGLPAFIDESYNYFESSPDVMPNPGNTSLIDNAMGVIESLT